MSVPKIEKITINMGLGSALGDKKILESALEELRPNFFTKANDLFSKKVSSKF